MAGYDLSLFFDDNDPAAAEKAAAMAAALRQQQLVGMLGQMSGDKVTMGVGQGLLSGAARGEQMLAEGAQGRLTRARQAEAAKAAAARAAVDDGRLQATAEETARHNREMEKVGFANAEAMRGQRGNEAASKLLDYGSKLRTEVLNNAVTKQAQEASVAFGKIKRAASGKPSAASDMSMIYGFMKAQDPESSVREGEYASAEKAKGVPDYIINLYNKAKDGQILTPQQRQDFLAQAGNLYAERLDRYKAFSSPYRVLAKKSGIDPDDVVVPLGLDEPDLALPGATSAAPNPRDARILQLMEAGLDDEAIKAQLTKEGL